MKASTVIAMLLGVVFAYEAQAQDSRPACNTTENRCIVTTDWDNDYFTPTCLDKPNSSSCTPAFPNLNRYADGNCDSTLLHTNCSYFMFDSNKLQTSSQTEDRSCGGTGFCGWRDGSNKSPWNGTSNSSRAKLHACAVNGSSDEQYYASSSSTCQGYASDVSINGYCDSSVWSALCSNAGF